MAPDSQPTPLEALEFAEPDYVWDERKAAERLKEKWGWAALAAYSLAIDTAADPESFDAYRLLVVDLIPASSGEEQASEPMIVPQALGAARRALASLEGNMRDSAEATLDFLEAGFSRIEAAGEKSGSSLPEEGTPGEEENKDFPETGTGDVQGIAGPQPLGEIEAERIVARLSAEGRLLPAWGRDALVQFVAALSTEKLISVDGSQISPADYFVMFVESLPALVPVNEFAAPQARRDNSLESLGRKIASRLESVR